MSEEKNNTYDMMLERAVGLGIEVDTTVYSITVRDLIEVIFEEFGSEAKNFTDAEFAHLIKKLIDRTSRCVEYFDYLGQEARKITKGE